jgi:YD repeat-containing protein
MHQLAVMRPYVKKHLQELRQKNQDEDLIMKQHKLHFTTWLNDLNLPVGETEEEKTIHLLTYDPHSLVKSWQAYDINGCTFYTKAKDSRSQCQNSGVRIDAEDSTRQKNAYYGYIEEI